MKTEYISISKEITIFQKKLSSGGSIVHCNSSNLTRLNIHKRLSSGEQIMFIDPKGQHFELSQHKCRKNLLVSHV